MSEAAMWRSLRSVLRPLDPVRVENPVVPGTPDLNYSHGWIELKFAKQWPPKEGPLRIDHFTRQQRAWLIRRRKAGGLAFVLLKVGKTEWLLFDGAIAATVLGYVSRERLYEVCLARWTRLPKSKEICACLLP